MALFFSLLFLSLLTWISPVHGRGKGPVGVWVFDDDIVIVGDSSMPGVVVVSIKQARALDRIYMNDPLASVGGVASCKDCDFIVVTANKGDYFRINLRDTVRNLLQSGGNDFFDGSEYFKLTLKLVSGTAADGRMLVLTENGRRAYISSSDDNSVYRFDFGKRATTARVTRILQADIDDPYGIDFDDDGNLLVVLNKRNVWRMTVRGRILDKYNLNDAGCPRFKNSPNLRHAIDDPITRDSILVLGTQPGSYDAALWRYNYNTGECVYFAGRTGYDSKWRDGVAQFDGLNRDIGFSRPHQFKLLPGPEDDPTIVITDIDNRALRLLHLKTVKSSSVMYDRDRRAELELAPGALWNRWLCWARELDFTSSYETIATEGYRSAAERPEGKARELTFNEAKEYCESRGARLCEPAELRQSGAAKDLTSWTSGECKSCWQPNRARKCDAEIVSFRSEGTHGPGFFHSWDDGFAYEIGADLPDGPATFCPGRSFANRLRLAAPCCADCE